MSAMGHCLWIFLRNITRSDLMETLTFDNRVSVTRAYKTQEHIKNPKHERITTTGRIESSKRKKLIIPKQLSFTWR